jgi:hypothetical protein
VSSAEHEVVTEGLAVRQTSRSRTTQPQLVPPLVPSDAQLHADIDVNLDVVINDGTVRMKITFIQRGSGGDRE